MSLSLVRASSQYAYVNDPVVTGFPFTFGCWFRADDVTNSQYLMSIGDKDATSTWFALVLRGDLTDDPVNLFRGNGGSWGTDGTVNAKIVQGRWYLAICSAAAADDVTLYCQEVSHHLTDSVAITGWDRVTIGTSADSTPSNYVGGLVGEAFIIDGTAITAGQVATLLADGEIADLSPTAYWPLRDDLEDAAGSNDLTAVNSPTFDDENVPQMGRPESVVSASNWTGDETDVDEITWDDADYLVGSEYNNDTIELALNELIDPESSDDHIIRIRARKDNAAGNARGVTVYLVENATVRATWVASADLSNYWTEFSVTLTSGEADSITDYTDLRIRITSTGSTGTPAYNRREVWVSHIELQLPSAPEASSSNDLSADDLTAGTPTFDAATIAQTFALTADDLTAGEPTFEAPTIGQQFDLAADDLVAGTPMFDAPTIAQQFELAADDLVAGTPTLDAPTLGQQFDLAADDLVAGTPTFEEPTIAQQFDLAADDLTAGAPTFDPATISQGQALSADDLIAAAPTFEAPTLGQQFDLAADDLVAGTPTFDAPAIAQQFDLAADDLVAGTPMFEAPTIGQQFDLAADDLVAGAPTFDAPTLGQQFDLAADDLVAGTPTFDAPAIGQQFDLMADDLVAGEPTFEAPTIEQQFDLAADDLVAGIPTFEAPTIGQQFDLAADDLTAGTPTFDPATISQGQALSADDLIAAAPTFEAPTIGQTFALAAADLTAGAPTFGAATLEQMISEAPASRVTVVGARAELAEVGARRGTVMPARRGSRVAAESRRVSIEQETRSN